MSTYYPSAIDRPGPSWKVWPDQNAREGVILHSLEGSGLAGKSQLVGTVQVSWHFTVLKDGSVWQHYPLEASCWHAGSRAQNVRLIGIEHEGKAGEPLTEPQAQASVSLVRWLAAECGWPLERHTRLLEHNEVYATACPSGRIPWDRYEEDDVQIRQLDQAESIEALNKAAEIHGNAINDNDGFTIVEVVAGSPVPLAPGQRAYLFVTN